LRELNLNHVRVEVRFAHEGWEKDLEAGIELTRQLKVPLELALFFCDGCKLNATTMIEVLKASGAEIAQWLILHESEKVPSTPWIELGVKLIETSGLGGVIAAGTNANFTELNRNRPDEGAYTALCYTVNPQVHAFDDLSLIETLAMQAETCRCTRNFGQGRHAILSPITLTQRFNAVATTGSAVFSYSEKADRRQKTAFGALWLAGSILNCSQGLAFSATYFKIRGPTGVMEVGAATGKDLYPMYAVLKFMGSLKGASVQRMESSAPIKSEAFAILLGETKTYLILNYSEQELSVEMELDPQFKSPKTIRSVGSDEAVDLPPTLPNGSIPVRIPGWSVSVLN